MKFIAMNRFKIITGREKEFEDIWRNRETYLSTVSGFIEFHLLRGEKSEDFTLILKLKKFSSSNNFILLTALSNKASGQGSLYFSNISFSSEPAFTPILIAQSLFFAAEITSLIFFFISNISRIYS